MNPLRQLNLDKDVKKAAIIHPGAIGDCVLTLPLAVFLKRTMGFHQIDLIGRTEYTCFYPARTAVDRVRCIESIPMHQLFAATDDFIAADPARLIHAFAEYEYIISFLGGDNPSFEQNLLFTVHSSHSGDVTILPMTPTDSTHAARFYIDEFVKSNPHLECDVSESIDDLYIHPLPADMAAGMDILSQAGIPEHVPTAIIQPGSGGAYKCRTVDKFIAIAENLRTRGVEPAFLLGPAEKERFSQAVKDRLQNAGRLLAGLNLLTVFQVLTSVDYYFGNDSGISHIAGAMGKKTEVFFGPTNPIHYRPLGPNVTVIQLSPQDF